MSSILQPQDLSRLFPIKEQYAYFMSSASGPLPRTTHEALVSFSEFLMMESSVDFERWLSVLSTTRASAARLLDCDSRCVAFVKNTGVGLAIAANMIDWQEGDELILPRGEFPSNYYPWLPLSSRGVRMVTLEPRDTHPVPRVTVETLLPLLSPRTRAVSLSFVQYDDGARRDVEKIGELLKERGIVYVIDAIQGLGVLPFSCQRSRADFVCAGSQKWLLSPPGAGLLYVGPDWLERNRVPNLGWLSVNDPFEFVPDTMEEAEGNLLGTAKRFEEGTSNFPGLAALGASIDLILSIGVETIAARVKQLTDRLVAGLLQAGCRVVSPRDDESWSGIVSFEHPELDSETIRKRLEEKRVITSVRRGWVRVAVHFFNDESEIDRLLAGLK
ncbi:MAG: aminotransferase class V-fold PLP-dependent enzyme [Candidatus Obscuribacterales bacterium]